MTTVSVISCSVLGILAYSVIARMSLQSLQSLLLKKVETLSKKGLIRRVEPFLLQEEGKRRKTEQENWQIRVET